MSTALGVSNVTSQVEAPLKLRTLFFLQGSDYMATFEALLGTLLARGHEVLVALEPDRRGLVPDTVNSLERIGQGPPGFRYVELRRRRDAWRLPAGAVRRSLDYLRYLTPAYGENEQLRAHARKTAPRLLLALLALRPFRWAWGRRLLGHVLGRLDTGMPVPRWLKAFIAEHRPDVVLVSPLVDFGSCQVDYVRHAQAQRIPCVLLVAGPDDLRAKGAIRDVPTLTVVTSDEQADEAVRLHGLPRERVVAVTGDQQASREQGVVRAIEGAPPCAAIVSRRGTLLRPILWLLTPLLLVVLPIVRPRETARRIAKWSRDRRRLRRHKRRDAEARRRKEEARAEKLAAKREPAYGQAKAQGADVANAEATAYKTKSTADGGKQAATLFRIRRSGGRVAKQAKRRVRAVRRGFKQARRSIRRSYNRRYRFTYAKTITRVPARDELPALLNARGLLGRGVEIGVKTGKYSEELLLHWRGAELISIDPWISVDWEEYVDRSNVSQDEFEHYYQVTCERLAAYGERSTIWRTTSVEAAKRLPDHSLDFAYIDARHDYESVKEDLAAWCAKVRPGGILAGHDYVDGDFPEGEFYVKSAVDEFFGERGIPVHGTDGPSAVESFPSWIVEVPEEGIELQPPER